MTIRSSVLQGDTTPDQRHGMFVLDNRNMLRVEIRNDAFKARSGAMVAYQGEARFTRIGSGVGKFLKKAFTGEGIDVMEVKGNADVYLADEAQNIQILELENDSICVNGKNVLAFSERLDYDIVRISAPSAYLAGGLYNVQLSGTGVVAVTTQGSPIALNVSTAPTYVDPQAAVLWTKGVKPSIRTDMGGVKSMLRGGTGEAIQLGFSGQGVVIVQASEQPRISELLSSGKSQGSGVSGSGLLDLFS